jgi:predicted acyltransferase
MTSHTGVARHSTVRAPRPVSPAPARPGVVMSDRIAVRLRSLDVLRGITVAAMVIVNNPGDWGQVYGPLLHAEWHGWTPTDLVFPFFLFIVGVSIALSHATSGGFHWVLRRGLVLFGFGLLLAGFPFFRLATWRIPGVLQRIALCYVAAVALTRLTTPRDGNDHRHLLRLAALIAAILFGYWAAMTWAPIPGGHAGDLSPAGNLGAWIDRALMGGHLWRADWDPEGLFSTGPAIATTLMGVVAGLVARRVVSTAEWRHRLLASGTACIVLGLLWDVTFPINKSLWTSSYVLFSGGAAAIALAICSWWVDDRTGGWRIATSEPFVALGRNAILLFVLSGLVARAIGLVMVAPGMSLKGWIYSRGFASLAEPKNASLMFAFANLAILYGLLAWLHRRRTYWRA